MATAVGMRRPLRAHERPHLVALGRLLGTVRRGAGLTQAELGLLAGLSRVQVTRIETGVSRTRRSTLSRLAAALVVSNPSLGSVARLTDDLAVTAGPALAEESAYAERVARRRATRTDAKWLADERADERRLRAYLSARERSEYWYWRSDQEKAEGRAAMWELFEQRRAELRDARRMVDRVQRSTA